MGAPRGFVQGFQPLEKSWKPCLLHQSFSFNSMIKLTRYILYIN